MGCYIFCLTWFTTVDIHMTLGESGKDLPYYIFASSVTPLWCGIHSKQCHYWTLILFSVSLTVLRGHLGNLDSSVGKVKSPEIMKSKEQARLFTRNVNNTFATVFALLFVKVFLLFYTVLYDSFINHDGVDWGSLTKVGPALQVIILYDLASGGSEIIDACFRTASKVLAHIPRSQSENDNDSWARLAQIVSYDELQDFLMISDCFRFTRQTLFSYVGIVITCTAVLLQFDYRILAKLDEDKRRYTSSSTPIARAL